MFLELLRELHIQPLYLKLLSQNPQQKSQRDPQTHSAATF